MTLINIVFIIFNIILWIVFLYQGVIALRGIYVRVIPPTNNIYHYGIIIPAHNEESMIGGLMKSLDSLNYDNNYLHILFVADHCSDNTENVIRRAGYSVINREEEKGNKTKSLEKGLSALLKKYDQELDAIAIFDADNIIDPEFFNEISKYLAIGENIIQGRVGIQNQYATVFTRLNYINGEVENRFKELAHSNAGLTCHLRGHGMVFRKQVLLEKGLKAESIVEDQELLVKYVLEGRRVEWAQGAEVNSVLPETTGKAATQRKRWAGGKAHITKKSVKALFGKWRMDKDWVAFDLMLDFIIPSHAVQLSLVFAGLLGSLLIYGINSIFFYSLLLLLITYTCYFIAGASLNGVPIRLFMNIAVAPFYIVWRTWIYLTSLRGAQKWR